MSPHKVGPEPFFPILGELNDSGAIYFLEGGQAVNIWARFIRTKTSAPEILRFDPFTSKDCDVYVSMQAFRFFENAEGTLHKSKSPADGQLAIYVLPEDESLHVDLMTSVYGIPMEQIPRAIKRAQVVEGLFVLDPIYLLKAKCHNLANLPQEGRQDEKHVGMMACILPEYLALIRDQLTAGNLTERQVIKELKFLIEVCTQDKVVKQVLQSQDVSLEQLIPMDRLTSLDQPALKKFLQAIK